jgi:hypothetical protein
MRNARLSYREFVTETGFCADFDAFCCRLADSGQGPEWCCFAVGDAGKLPDKSQVPYPPTHIRLGFAGRQGAGDAGAGIGVRNCLGVGFGRVISSDSRYRKSNFSVYGTVSRLARKAAFNAKLPRAIGTSYVPRIFSMTRSIKKLKICSSRSRTLMNASSGSTRLTNFGSTSCQQTMSTQLRCEMYS